MLKKFEVVVVPEWLQSTINNGTLTFSDTKDFNALSRILSKHDVILYYIANKYFFSNVGEKFNHSFDCLSVLKVLPSDSLTDELSIALRYGDATLLKNYYYYLTSNIDDSVDGFTKKLGFDVIKCDGSVLWLKPIIVTSDNLIVCYNNLFKAMFPFVSLTSLAELPIFRDYEQMVHNETAMLKK